MRCEMRCTRSALTRAAPLLAFVYAGCAGGDEAAWQGTVRDSAGVRIVDNPAEGAWREGEGWTVEEELRIGALEGEPEYQFGQIGSIAVGSDGRLFVLDAEAQHIKIFDAEGTYQTTAGGKGGGPGELQGAILIYTGRGDTLLVPDVQNQRMNRYGPDGSVLPSYRLSLEGGLPMLFRATPSGVVAEQLRPLRLTDEASADSMDVIVVLGDDGAPADTLVRFRSGETFDLGGGVPRIRLYASEVVWDLTEEVGLVMALNSEYRIRRYSPAGELELVITRPFEPRPVTDGDKQPVLGWLERAWRDAGVPPATLEALMSGVEFAEYFPAFAQVLSGPSGTIWVQEIQPASLLGDEERSNYNLFESAGSANWDLFDADGRYLGVVRMPDRFAPRLLRGDLIYGVWRDELDVQYVMRLRIVEPTG